MEPSTAIVLVLVAVVAQYPTHAAADPKVIIVGAGMSGKSIAVTLDACMIAWTYTLWTGLRACLMQTEFL
jgi:hypothetical protein